ncbi:MAG: Alpha/Beta hydrolase protein [Benjaminiella poitrasii]|nr:MAG: Alpha/Beta hydrolase protein [Benjaminiella poitrasii]
MGNFIDTPLSDSLLRPAVTVEKISIPSQESGRMIDVDVYRPKNAADVLPAFVYIHGGGWIFPAQSGHVYLAEKLASETNCAVLLVHYKCGPTIPHSIEVEECYSVVAYATSAKYAKELNIDPKRVAVGGDSAGGNMSACITLIAKEKKPLENPLKLQVLYYPCTSGSVTTKSHQEFGRGNLLNTTDTEKSNKYYFTEQDKQNPYVFPLNASAEQLTGVPPAFIMTCEADVLRDEGEIYARKLLEAKVPVSSVRINTVIHGFMSLVPLYSEAVETVFDMTTGALRRAFLKP